MSFFIAVLQEEAVVMPSACNLAQEAGEHLGHGSSQGAGILRADYGAAHAVDAAVGIGGVGSVCRDCANRAFGGAASALDAGL